MNKLLKVMGIGVTMLLPLGAPSAEESAWQPSQVADIVGTNSDIAGDVSSIVGLLNGTSDLTREQLAQALINYEAKARLADYRLQEEKMFMAAPGSPDAIQAGLDVGNSSVVTTYSKVMSSAAVAAGLPVGGGGLLATSQLIDKAEDYLADGNPELLGPFNASNVLQEDVVTQAVSQDFINIITNPTPSALNIVTNSDGDIQWGPGGTDRVKVADRLIEQALMSIAANSLGEIAAKRVVVPPSTKSLSQILRDESERRFKDVEWYKNVGISSQEALLRELTQMEAFRTMLQYQQYRLQEQNASLLAAMLSSIAKMTSTLNLVNKTMQQSIPSPEQLQEMTDSIEDIDLDDYDVPEEYQ